jgi:hypothetical protein
MSEVDGFPPDVLRRLKLITIRSLMLWQGDEEQRRRAWDVAALHDWRKHAGGAVTLDLETLDAIATLPRYADTWPAANYSLGMSRGGGCGRCYASETSTPARHSKCWTRT